MDKIISIILICFHIIVYLCTENKTKNEKIMCTVTLEYNKNNALARRKLAALLATGLFYQVKSQEPTSEEVEAHRQLRDAALEHSRKSMSHVIARYL